MKLSSIVRHVLAGAVAFSLVVVAGYVLATAFVVDSQSDDYAIVYVDSDVDAEPIIPQYDHEAFAAVDKLELASGVSGFQALAADFSAFGSASE